MSTPDGASPGDATRDARSEGCDDALAITLRAAFVAAIPDAALGFRVTRTNPPDWRTWRAVADAARAALASRSATQNASDDDMATVSVPHSRDAVLGYLRSVQDADDTLPDPSDAMVDEVWRFCREVREFGTVMPLAVMAQQRGESYAQLRTLRPEAAERQETPVASRGAARAEDEKRCPGCQSPLPATIWTREGFDGPCGHPWHATPPCFVCGRPASRQSDGEWLCEERWNGVTCALESARRRATRAAPATQAVTGVDLAAGRDSTIYSLHFSPGRNLDGDTFDVGGRKYVIRESYDGAPGAPKPSPCVPTDVTTRASHHRNDEGGGHGDSTTGEKRIEVLPLVLADLQARVAKGEKLYGEPLTTHNGRRALQDAYEEALDLALYLRQALAERDATRGEKRADTQSGVEAG